MTKLASKGSGPGTFSDGKWPSKSPQWAMAVAFNRLQDIKILKKNHYNFKTKSMNNVVQDIKILTKNDQNFKTKSMNNIKLSDPVIDYYY